MSNVVLQNLGPDYRRSSGRVVRRGETFEATHAEVASMQKRKQLGIRFMIVADGSQPTSQSEPVTVEGVVDSQTAQTAGQEGAATAAGWPTAEGSAAAQVPKARKPRKPKAEEQARPKRARSA